MAAYVMYSLEDGLHTRLCHLGQSLDDIPLNAVESIQCDGHELELAERITGRKPPFSVFVFVDSQAREIVANWR